MSQKRLLILGAIGAVLLVLVCCLIPHGSSHNNTATPPTTEQPDWTEPPIIDIPEEDEKSQYNPNHVDVYCMIPTIATPPIDLSSIKIFTTSDPNVEFAMRVHAEDVITFEVSNIPYGIRPEDIKAYGIPHSSMKDPYVTSIDQYTNKIFETAFSKRDDKLVAQAMVGYGVTTDTLLDVLFVYKGQICYYAMFHVDNDIKNTLEGWQHAYPDETFEVFYIQHNDKKMSCYYASNKVKTLTDWMNSTQNVYALHLEKDILANGLEEWMLTLEQGEELLTPDKVFHANDYVKPEPHKFETDNNKYAVSYLGKNKDEIVAILGQPQSSNEQGAATKMVYADKTIYLTNNVCVQVDLTSQAEPINGLPGKQTNAEEIAKQCQYTGISDYEIKGFISDDGKTFYYRMMLQYENWTVCYIWETTEAIEIATTNFTRVVVYSGDNVHY